VLSVAAGVVQFVDFSSRLIRHIAELNGSDIGNSRRSGELLENAELLQSLTFSIISNLSPETLHRKLTDREEELALLCRECNSTAIELSGILRRLSPGIKLGKWESVKIAFDAFKSERKVASLSQKLEQFKIHLTLNIVADIRYVQNKNPRMK